ncbi:glycosyltransferase family 39 protein [Pedosphaera parvula]|uniref:Phosphoesterase PA-phosphatase related protein n=1 Tax=Pedosphaera parvula (strain Ellin514) TaxID=320771 RepID=B9XGL1_PEDPL|nr:glycosyltransferase family 39 protein [Pedosphaera parvula]EEF61062.1 phosphoesterase PA-phosphatase related protein [Pedosphaera parvula Ellin514]
MHWLQALDAQLFHFVNSTLSNSLFEVVMPFLSGNPLFLPALLLVCAILVIAGGARGRICVAFLLLGILLGDSLLSNSIKHAIARPRPFNTLAAVHIPHGMGVSNSFSMPSSHATNWFTAAMITFIFYRRSWRFMLPLACLVAFSRVYCGMHYPSDVLVGAILGAGSAAALVWTLNFLWISAGKRWFPLWWQKLPSLLQPDAKISESQIQLATPGTLDQHLIRLGYVLIFAQLFARLIYIASGRLQISEDEAYQWLWSKHLALSYYSKPPLIAYVQWLGTHIWGDNVFGVRFFSPIISTIVSVALLRFMARTVGARAAFWMSALRLAIPFMLIGSILMTIDPLSVMFYTLAMIAGWSAVQENATIRNWSWVGLWMGLGFLSKYTGLFQLASWVLLFVLWPPARKQLRKPGPYVALLINLICALPVLIWNYQHHWITVQHVANDGSLQQDWNLSPAQLLHSFQQFTLNFIGAELVLLNPFFLIPTIFAAFVFWRYKSEKPILVYFFSMGAPIVAAYFLLTFHARVLPNWIAPSIIPMFCLAVVYYDLRWQQGSRRILLLLVTGLVLGSLATIFLHETKLINRIVGVAGYTLPPNKDPLRRLTAWTDTAQVVEDARQKLSKEGKPVFIIGGHYGIASQIAFNLPEARKCATADDPLVYFITSEEPVNQFYFWPGYESRKGQNAIYVQELDLIGPPPPSPPEQLEDEFESVTDLDAVYVLYRDQRIRRIQICECRGLR